jgi:hypothetical protein
LVQTPTPRTSPPLYEVPCPNAISGPVQSVFRLNYLRQCRYVRWHSRLLPLSPAPCIKTLILPSLSYRPLPVEHQPMHTPLWTRLKQLYQHLASTSPSEQEPTHQDSGTSGSASPPMASSDKVFLGAIDQGTTSSRFLIFDVEGRPIVTYQLEFKQIYPQSGYIIVSLALSNRMALLMRLLGLADGMTMIPKRSSPPLKSVSKVPSKSSSGSVILNRTSKLLASRTSAKRQ